ncbi:MAG: glycosyltransferase family 4 protein [Dehalococcoidia bacterium]|nr:glycosyltransferase family 4 protein [Dehalococcoidia bacterium]
MSRQRSIRRVVLALQSTAVGGMETHVVDLAAEYVRRGITTSVFVPEAPLFDGVAARVTAAGAGVLRLDTDARGGRRQQLPRLLRLGRTLRALRPDAVHLHTGGATGGLGFVALARAATRATVVVTEHDVPVEAPTRPAHAARLAMDRLGHTLVAVSRRNARLRRERLGVHCGSFAAILNGVPLDATTGADRTAGRERVRASLGIDRDAVVVGSLVRLAEGKGLLDLLPAFAIVRKQAPGDLLLVGDGPLRGELEALAATLGIADHVHFAGNQPDPAPYLDAMDVFALAVPAGSMSIALLEAMGRGLPPVITFCGPEEAVIPGETGLGAEPRNPESLAVSLALLVTNPGLRARLGAAAAAHVRRHFSVARVADDLLELYALHGASTPPRLRADGPANPRPGHALVARPEGTG